MKNIEIEDDLYKYILTNIEAFGETPSQILRRLLSLPENAEKNNKIDDFQVEVTEATNTVEKSDNNETDNNAIDDPNYYRCFFAGIGIGYSRETKQT